MPALGGRLCLVAALLAAEASGLSLLRAALGNATASGNTSAAVVRVGVDVKHLDWQLQQSAKHHSRHLELLVSKLASRLEQKRGQITKVALANDMLEQDVKLAQENNSALLRELNATREKANDMHRQLYAVAFDLSNNGEQVKKMLQEDGELATTLETHLSLLQEEGAELPVDTTKLDELGTSLSKVHSELETEVVASFTASYNELLQREDELMGHQRALNSTLMLEHQRNWALVAELQRLRTLVQKLDASGRVLNSSAAAVHRALEKAAVQRADVALAVSKVTAAAADPALEEKPPAAEPRNAAAAAPATAAAPGSAEPRNAAAAAPATAAALGSETAAAGDGAVAAGTGAAVQVSEPAHPVQNENLPVQEQNPSGQEQSQSVQERIPSGQLQSQSAQEQSPSGQEQTQSVQEKQPVQPQSQFVQNEIEPVLAVNQTVQAKEPEDSAQAASAALRTAGAKASEAVQAAGVAAAEALKAARATAMEAMRDVRRAVGGESEEERLAKMREDRHIKHIARMQRIRQARAAAAAAAQLPPAP